MLDERGGSARLALAGISTGLLLLVHARNAGLVLALLVLAGYRWWQRGTTPTGMVFVAGFAAVLVARTALTYHLWGTWLTTPHARPGEWEGARVTLAVMGRRFAGLLIDQEYGLLLYSPIFLLALFALGPRSGASREIRGAIALSIAAYLLTILMPMTNIHGWTGGWSPAGRFWVPIVPLLAMALALGIKSAPRAVVITLVALQIGISAYFWQQPKNLWNDGDGMAAVCARGSAAFCGSLPSLTGPADYVGEQ